MPSKSAPFTPSSILVRPHQMPPQIVRPSGMWWRRRVLPPGPIGLLRRPFIAIAGRIRHPQYRAVTALKKSVTASGRGGMGEPGAGRFLAVSETECKWRFVLGTTGLCAANAMGSVRLAVAGDRLAGARRLQLRGRRQCSPAWRPGTAEPRAGRPGGLAGAGRPPDARRSWLFRGGAARRAGAGAAARSARGLSGRCPPADASERGRERRSISHLPAATCTPTCGPSCGFMTGPDWLLALLVIGVGAPLSEELLFRGFLQSALAQSRLGFCRCRR